MNFDYDKATLKASWGVYAIENSKSGRRYIGGTARNFFERWKAHWYELQNGNHDNKALQWDWLFLGSDKFRFVILEAYTERAISEWERLEFWAQHREAVCIRRSTGLYNVTGTASETLAGTAAQRSATRLWNAFYGTDLIVFDGPPWKHPTLSTADPRGLYG
jgi:hypothetical protein